MDDQTRQLTGWQVEQSASAAYEQYLVPAIFAPWAHRLLDTVGVNDGDRILDVACGTGIVARQAASRVGSSGSVVGIDIKQQMLSVAEAAAGEQQPSIEWRQADATELPFAGDRFDVVCCQQALQFFDDPSAALDEMYRVLTPGGRLAASVWRALGYQPVYVALADALERHIGADAGTMMRSPFPNWDADDLRTPATDAGFADVSVTCAVGSVRYPSVSALIRREAASSPLAEAIAAVEPAVRGDLVRELEQTVHMYVDDEGVVSPMESYVITAGK